MAVITPKAYHPPSIPRPVVSEEHAEEEQDEPGQEDDLDEFPLGGNHLLLRPYGIAASSV